MSTNNTEPKTLSVGVTTTTWDKFKDKFEKGLSKPPEYVEGTNCMVLTAPEEVIRALTEQIPHKHLYRVWLGWDFIKNLDGTIATWESV